MSFASKMAIGSTGVGGFFAVAARLTPLNRYDGLGEGRMGFDCESPVFVAALVTVAATFLVIGVMAAVIAGRKDGRKQRVVLVLAALGLLLVATILPRLHQEWSDNQQEFSPCL